MSNIAGYQHTVPVIEAVHFFKEKFTVCLADGRIISIPINRFPEIKKLSTAQKRRHKLLGGLGLMFDDIDTVYHVSDFTGNSESSYDLPKKSVRKRSSERKTSASVLAEPKAKYHSRKKVKR